MHAVLDELTRRTADVVDALATTDLDAPSELPVWSRLTIACHLRYGAEALRWMTLDSVAGRPTAYYPAGRDAQRPGTLAPRPGESPADVVGSLRDASAALHDVWTAVDDWDLAVDEPEGVFPTLQVLPILRLTEIEVHGTDLGVGLGPWSDALIEHGTPMRLARLQQRAPQARGAWLLNGVRLGDDSEPEIIDASDRDLFALLLGRIELSESFRRAFPGP